MHSLDEPHQSLLLSECLSHLVLRVCPGSMVICIRLHLYSERGSTSLNPKQPSKLIASTRKQTNTLHAKKKKKKKFTSSTGYNAKKKHILDDVQFIVVVVVVVVSSSIVAGTSLDQRL